MDSAHVEHGQSEPGSGAAGANGDRVLALDVRGAVQGVGFRPFVYRLASTLGLRGYVTNTAQGVMIEVEGARERLMEFRRAVVESAPSPASVESIIAEWRNPAGYTRFEILHSATAGEKTAQVLADIATCPACLAEVLDPGNRRYRYPFTNCTHCGPRFSIIESIPYDRANTSMRAFEMCPKCREEYENPGDRRFHAQPNACPECGPRLELWNDRGGIVAQQDDALRAAAEAVRQGHIVALKGLGGFHLVVDARNDEAVAALRMRKQREDKPLALMFPDMESVRRHCSVSPLEERLLTSSAAPIVLLRRAYHDSQMAPSIAPGNPCFGGMLPYTPLHHLLMRELGFPVVATSGNHSDDPICIDECDAFERLFGVADVFLTHNRPIVRPVDDSVVRVMMGREIVLRRGRGYAPAPLPGGADGISVLAVGGHLKNTVAVVKGENIHLSQHLGDLETVAAVTAFERAIESVEALYDVRPEVAVCDAHPDYHSAQYARTMGIPVVEIQHHHAHVAACMAENSLNGPVLGVAWDGAGFGEDGATWGGEFLSATLDAFQRVAHLREFRLPGGDAASREPRRSALAVLYEVWGGAGFAMRDLPSVAEFSEPELKLIRTALERGVNAPQTTSAGRLFDAVASLLGIRQESRFEGQAAMELERAIAEAPSGQSYPFGITAGPSGLVVNWDLLVSSIVDDIRKRTPRGEIAARFHNTLAEVIVTTARRTGFQEIVLTGGCFQNKYLLERAVSRLTAEGMQAFWHRRVPPNDGGIAFGQAVIAAERIRRSRCTDREIPPCA
ncbi:MAG: carbamoyltransferase HypF [Candidatus Hydrogenedentes bacterium]|nr:carbamoyltransferase HypF [Candidatus Hydrogenedentota bacterium]